MKGVAAALAADLESRFGLDLAGSLASLQRRLDELDAEIRAEVGTIPPGRRKLVTGHESLGYFAQRYGFTLVGAVVPSLSSQAESSAADFAALGRLVAQSGIDVIFTETGTPARTAQALARETGARAVGLATHSVPADGSYISYARALARTITEALR
jgi:zinc/manganese transport system substrate-binding protein